LTPPVVVDGGVVGTSNESETADDHGSDLARGPRFFFLVQISTFFLIQLRSVLELADPIGQVEITLH
jgi:hypothetical protein